MARARLAKPRKSKRFWSAARFSDRKNITPAKARTPIGRLMKNTQRQLRLSVSQPPRAGPSMGPSTAPAPQTAMAWPCFSGGLMSSRTAWDNGISAAPNTPCNRRNSTISTRLLATPHSTEAAVKPAIEIRNTILRPILSARKPVSGVMIAAETIYEVSTQVICSAEAETLPWMWGRATLAMVVSSEFITVASMMETVIAARFDPSPAALRAAAIIGRRPCRSSRPAAGGCRP